MDIDLLSKMVKELILDNDKVVLPDLGCFVAEIVPSSFSDKGYTINPPYRKLSFRAHPDSGDLLIQFYAQSNKVELDIADKIIRDFIKELKSILFSRKVIALPGLGRLRATKENNVFFIADEDLDIYPAGFGLEPISLKTHQESAEQVAEAVEGLKQLLDSQPVVTAETVAADPNEQSDHAETAEPSEPVVTVVSVEEQQTEVLEPEDLESKGTGLVDTEAGDKQEILEPQEKPAEEPVTVIPVQKEEVKKKGKSLKKVWITLLVIILAAVLALGIFVAVARLFPGSVDSLLYSEEELEVLNYKGE